jgi:predicted nuclease of predicted toxin-antitoxin system
MVRLYLDENVHGDVARGLARRGVDVLTAQADGRDATPDPEVLDRATELGRVLFSQDEDLLAEAHRRQDAGIPFAGVVYTHQDRLSVGELIRQLQVAAEAGEPGDFQDRVTYLPL